ncbi:MAG: hypothetical protein JXO44_12145 [Clostridia bacterium]|nr:hypothetical protein [Clostridia bacterium]
MTIHNVNGVTGASAVTQESVKKNEKAAKETKTESAVKNTDTEVVYEKSEVAEEEETKSLETYGKEAKIKYAADIAAVEEMKRALDKKMKNSFLQMAIDSLGEQQTGIKAKLEAILKENSGEITDEMIEQAKEDVSEDGYYGVEATAKRLVDFAKALSGGDPDKAEMLKDAFLDGFKQAEELWGDDLPEISQKTKTRTEELFDVWINGTEAVAEGSEDTELEAEVEAE